jgi:hypothetical protein
MAATTPLPETALLATVSRHHAFSRENFFLSFVISFSGKNQSTIPPVRKSADETLAEEKRQWPDDLAWSRCRCWSRASD